MCAGAKRKESMSKWGIRLGRVVKIARGICEIFLTRPPVARARRYSPLNVGPRQPTARLEEGGRLDPIATDARKKKEARTANREEVAPTGISSRRQKRPRDPRVRRRETVPRQEEICSFQAAWCASSARCL